MRLAAQEASDLEQNPAAATEVWNQYISQSYKRLYDMLVGAYSNDYYIANTYQFQTTNTQLYALPDGSPSYSDMTGAIAQRFYKLILAEIQYSGSPSGWLTLRNFMEIEKNKFGLPNTQTTWTGYTNLRYRIQGDNIFLTPTPMTGQTIQLTYVPAPTNLQFRLPCYTVSGSAVVGSISDTTGITVGMNISANFTTGVVPASTTILAVSTTTVTMSSNAQSTQNAFTLSMWNDGTLMDGIAGWDQFVIVDAARKAMGKLEFDATDMKQERDAMLADIQAMAEARDASQAFHVSDALGANGWAYDGDDGSWGQY